VKSPKTLLILLLALTTLGGAALAWRQYQELIDLRAAAMDPNERANLQKQLADLEKANRALQDQLAAIRTSGDENSDELMAGNASERPGGDQRGRGPRDNNGRGRGGFQQQFAAVRELMAKPEVQAMIAVQQKAVIESRYGALIKNLNLAPDQSDQLKTLLAERMTSRQDVLAAARDQGIDPRTDPAAFNKMVTAAQDEVNNNIKALLGDSGYSQLQNYDQTLPQRNIVNELQARLANSNAPLSSSQSEQLVQILAANAPQRQQATATVAQAGGDQPQGGRGGPGGGGGFGGLGRGGDLIGLTMAGGNAVVGPNAAPITPTAVAQAQPILTPQQTAALQQLQQQQQTAQQLQQLVRQTLQQNTPATQDQNGTNPTGTGTGTGGTRRRNGGG
jgi:hypothetical protein